MNEEKRFQRKKEDFVCEKCKTKVKGDGYTDHCPTCLWSKHVDISPGDRKASCKGMMEPSSVNIKGDGFIIYYRCIRCGLENRVKSTSKDNTEEIIKINKKSFLK